MSNKSLPATRDNIRHAINIIERQRGGGGTRLLPALKRALALPRMEGYSRNVVIATDGYVAVEEQAFDLIRNNLGNANMFAFGIGSSVNRHIIEGMARVGMGEPFVITRPEGAPEKAKKFRKMIQSPVLTGIKMDFGRFQVYDVEPPSIPDVLADRPVIVFGKWRGRPQGRIELRGISGDRPFKETLDVDKVRGLETNSALRYLWARHRIGLLSDYNRLSPKDERVREVTNLGLTYSLLTAYTSFVAVDTRVRLVEGQVVTVKQPLPLPQGVSDLAVGRRLSARSAAKPYPVSPSTMARERSKGGKWLASKDEVSRSAPMPNNAQSAKIHMELGKIEVPEGLARRSVERVIQKALPAINKCYKVASGNRSGPKGKFLFRLVVAPDGRVIRVHREKGKNSDRAIERCMTQGLKALKFPAHVGNNNVEVKITFILK